jgi:hypothetical protein
MATVLEDVRETLTGQPRRRWLPWRRKPTLTERVGEVTERVGQTAGGLAEQVGQTATDLTGQVAQTTGHLMQRLKGAPQARPARADTESLLSMRELSGGADFPAERAAVAAEAASLAAQRAAGAVERVDRWLALLASRTPQPVSLQARQGGMPEAALAQPPAPEEGKQGGGAAGAIKRTAMRMGQRLSELSDGRYGLKTQPPRAETKQEKKAEKRLERLARKEAKAEQPGAGVRWLPWAVGLSLGLVIGVVGVAYWQRRRLQDMWTQTSQRVQQTTEVMRQRLESSRAQPQPGQASIAPEATSLGPLGSTTQVSESDRQVDGRIESTWQ